MSGDLQELIHVLTRHEVDILHAEENPCFYYIRVSDAVVLRTEIERLRARLDAIQRHWQYGVQEIDSPWRRRMAELVGDEAVQAAGGSDGD